MEKLEARYFKDYKYNYLSLKCENIGVNERYQQKILESNKIEKILNCSVRNINGSAFYYYDISSKVSLENFYHRKQMSYEQVKDFFEQMNLIYENLAVFLMNENGLLLDPEYIYYDIGSKQYFGLYYPGLIAETENKPEALMDFLINHIDNENQQLTSIVYQIYEMAEEKFFSWADVLCLFEKIPEEAYETDRLMNSAVKGTGRLIDSAVKETDYFTDDKGNMSENYGEVSYPDFLDNMDYGAERATEDARQKEFPKDSVHTVSAKKEEGNKTFYVVFALLSLCGIGGEFWIYQTYQLTQQENSMLMCCMVLTALCCVFSIAQTMLSNKRSKKQKEEDNALRNEIEDEFRDAAAIPLHDVLNKDMGRDIFTDAIPVEVRNKRQPKTVAAHEQQEWYGETVFIDLNKQKDGYKLYALDEKNKQHIELTKFPFIIGKMPGSVDCVLANHSISRLHARIDKQEDRLFLTDMNSTNGTYKNGLRMKPNETIEMEVGDEIRFGNLNYCYR